MAETANIAKIAELLSADILSVFGWKLKGPKNYSWPCLKPEEHHKKRIKKLHPTDAVFIYTDPYTGQPTYVLADLKSYSVGTLYSTDLSKSLRSLGQTVECAKISSDWQQLYADQSDNIEVVGMLFIYNHDNKLDKDFFKLLDAATPGRIDVPKGQRVFILSPERILALNSAAKDILILRGKDELPPALNCSFPYPDLVNHKSFESHSRAATIESLLAPWLIISYRSKGSLGTGKIVYLLQDGSSIDDFKYLFDYMFRYQMVSEEEKIRVRAIRSSPDAASNFDTAILQYSRDYWPLAATSQTQSELRMKSFSFESVTTVVESFSQIEIGLRT